MVNFWDSNVWSFLMVITALLVVMMIAHILKRNFKFLKKSLIPVSVLGGIIALIFTTTYKLITGENFFSLEMFSIVNETTTAAGEVVRETALDGIALLEIITYHALAVGFICMGLKSSKKADNNKKRTEEVFNTGITTVSTYLIQAILGLIVTIVAFKFIGIDGLIPAAGIILCLGYGQGTGQALNFGTQYESVGLAGGANFGLAIAALGFLSASIGGVIYLNILRKKKKIKEIVEEDEKLTLENYQGNNEIPTNLSIDKFTIQIAIVGAIYILSYLIMNLLSKIVSSLSATLFGFNFLIGTLLAVLFKFVIKKLREKKIVKREYINDFMMNRIGGSAFDIMIVAGIAAIDLETLKNYIGLLIILAIIGLVSTFIYIRFVCKKLFPEYKYEQFFAMYGMLTGTASTGVILLREIDPNYDTPASDNLVYQNLPAIIFGLPIMFLVPWAAESETACYTVFAIIVCLLIVLELILFRKQIFKKRKAK